MSNPLIDDEGEVRELTLADFKLMVPIRKIHPDMPKWVQLPQEQKREETMPGIENDVSVLIRKDLFTAV